MSEKNLFGGAKPRNWIRTVYLYLVCAITIVMVLIASVQAVQVGLDVYVLKIDRPQYWYNECMDPKRMDGDVAIERTEEEQAACEEKALVKAREQLTQERRHSMSQALAMFLVALPLYLYHWSVIQRDPK